MTHRSSAYIISLNHMQIKSPLSSHFGSAAICSFKSFVQKDSRFQSISEGLGMEMPQSCIMPLGLPTYKGFTWFCFTWDRGLFRGWSLKKVADMGGFLARSTSACNHLRCYAHQMWRNILIQVGERNDVELNGRFRSHFQRWTKMAFQKLVQHSSTATISSKKTSLAKFQGNRYLYRISRIKHVQVDGGTHDRKWRRSWEVWEQEEPGGRADTGCCSMLNVYMEHDIPVS